MEFYPSFSKFSSMLYNILDEKILSQSTSNQYISHYLADFMNEPAIAFTLKANQRLKAIHFDIGLSLQTQVPLEVDERLNVTALWDTSRSHTVITPSLYDRLVQQSQNPESANKLDLYLPNNIRIADLSVRLLEDENPPYACCIGMDIITLGDSAFTHVDGKSVFSFSIPSTQTLDFVAEQTKTNKALKPSRNAIVAAGRNQRCPCGSGKKHKNCCAQR